jgi:hypothetical protein
MSEDKKFLPYRPSVNNDRSKNELNLSHNDLKQIYELSKDYKPLADVIVQLKVLWTLYADSKIDDALCYPQTWRVPKATWVPIFNQLIHTNDSVVDALKYTLDVVYGTSNHEGDFSDFEPIEIAEREDYISWFREIKEQDPDFDYHYTDLDIVTK